VSTFVAIISRREQQQARGGTYGAREVEVHREGHGDRDGIGLMVIIGRRPVIILSFGCACNH